MEAMRSGGRHERVPSVAAGVHDDVVGVADAVGEAALAQEPPDVLDRVEVRARRAAR
jgi:hypothetical protein